MDKDGNGKINGKEKKAVKLDPLKHKYADTVLCDLFVIASSGDDELICRLKTLEESENLHTISQPRSGDKNHCIPKGNLTLEQALTYKGSTFTSYNPWQMTPAGSDAERPPSVALVHELIGHAYEWNQGSVTAGQTTNGIPLNEIEAIIWENRMRKTLNCHLRTTFGALDIPPQYIIQP